MRVVHIVEYYHPDLGYQEPALARAHRDLGHEVTVITSDRMFPFPNYEQAYAPRLGPRIVGAGESSHDGIRVVRLGVRATVRGFVLYNGLGAALRAATPDLVIHHGVLHPAFFQTARASRRAPWALVADSHMAVYNTRPGSLGPRAFLALHRLLLGRFIRRRVRVLAIGPCEKAFLERELPGLPVEVVPLGADPARFQPHPARRAAARARLGFAAGDVVLIHAGKFLADKKTAGVVRAFKALQPEFPALKLLLVGAGTEACEREVAAECAGATGITRLPLVANSDLADLLGAADIGAWPGSPSIVFFEAMAMGLPLILADGEYGRFIVRSGNGRLVSSEQETAAVLREWMLRPARRLQAAQNARDLFLREFRSDHLAARFLLPAPGTPTSAL